MRVLLVAIGHLRGHVQPLLAIGDALRRQGAVVGWWSDGPITPSCDVDFERIAPPGDPQLPEMIAAYGAFRTRAAGAFRDPSLTVELRRLGVRFFDADVRRARQAVQAFQPDVIAVDGALGPKMVGFREENVPFAGICTGLQYLAPRDFRFETDALEVEYREERAAAFARHGWAPEYREAYCVSPHLNVVFATEALAGALERPPNTHLVGHGVLVERRREEAKQLGFPMDRLSTTKPILYASFGSMHEDLPLARLVAEAARVNEAQLVLAAGSGAKELADIGGDAIVVEQAPQIEVLARASGFVTHAGANSIMEAMYMGVPVLLAPLCADQPLNAFIVQSLGSKAPGLSIDPATATLDGMARAVRELLRGPYRANAARIAESYRAEDGGARAAELVSALVAPGK